MLGMLSRQGSAHPSKGCQGLCPHEGQDACCSPAGPQKCRPHQAGAFPRSPLSTWARGTLSFPISVGHSFSMAEGRWGREREERSTVIT